MTTMPVEQAAKRPLVMTPYVIGMLIVAGIAAVVIPSVRDARHRGKQVRTMGDMRTIATSLESYSIDHRDYPTSRTPPTTALDEITPVLVPTYVKALPRLDGWGRKFELVSTAKEYTIISRGSDGRPDTPDGPSVSPNGGTTSFINDLIFSTGSFAQFPASGRGF